jgi:PST family polysaccharide transporter
MMVISFAEIFTDAGFQKFLIQHEFESDEELYQSTNVAFWTNLIFSLLIWGLIIIFSQPIAELVGSPNESSEIAVAGCCIPLAAFSSIQMALYKRGFDFKTLFYVRIVGVLIPLFVTVPLALYFRNCWALILGVIAQNFSNALLLTLKSPWKPNRFYSFAKLKEMFSFSMWSMIESVTVWLTLNMDIFFIGRLLSPYYLGLYRTSINTVGQVNSVITSATTPVLYSSLSRLQEEGELFKNLFFKFQKTVALLVFPLGAMIYIFRDYVTYLLLGSQWGEAAYFVGLWGVSSAIVIVFSNFCCDVYRAKGKPKLIFYVHAVYNIVLVFMLYFSVDKGFAFLCEMRTLCRIVLIGLNLFVMKKVVGITCLMMLRNVFPSLMTSICIIIISFLLPSPQSLIYAVGYFTIYMLFYLFIITRYKSEKNMFSQILFILKKENS